MIRNCALPLVALAFVTAGCATINSFRADVNPTSELLGRFASELHGEFPPATITDGYTFFEFQGSYATEEICLDPAPRCNRTLTVSVHPSAGATVVDIDVRRYDVTARHILDSPHSKGRTVYERTLVSSGGTDSSLLERVQRCLQAATR